MKLVLLATPLQAIIAQSVLEAEPGDAYDLVYSARSDLPSHRHYYERLARSARQAAYVADVEAPSALLRHVKRRITLRTPYFRTHYDTICLASIDGLLFRSLVGRNPQARVVTFDDGAANVFSGSRFHAPAARADRFLERVFGIPTTPRLRERIDTHYSLYADHPNIAPSERVRVVSPWRDRPASAATGERTGTSFFLGQPFPEAITAGGIDRAGVGRLRQWLAANPVDYYLAHPREADTLGHGNVLRSPEVAEEQVFRLAGDTRPRIYGWFTSVLLNIPASAADKWYLSTGTGPAEDHRIELMRRAGCGVLHV